MSEPLRPKVSVLMLTYQHERFLAQALDSALAQRTDFPVEIVVCDDASKDRTPEIARAYAAAHPSIRAVINEKNLGVHGNLKLALETCTGEYIAFLEGDDYWVGTDKLADQAAYLDAHPEIVAVGHNLACVDPDGKPLGENAAPEPTMTLTSLEAAEHLVLPTNSMLVRAAPIRADKLPAVLWTMWPPDDALRAVLAHAGGFYYDQRVRGAYRIHPGGVWSSRKNLDRARLRVHFYETLPTFTDTRFHPGFARRLVHWRAVEAYELAGIGDVRGTLGALRAVRRPRDLWRHERSLVLRALVRAVAPGVYARLRQRVGG